MSRIHPGILLCGYLAAALLMSWAATRNGAPSIMPALACATLFSAAIALESYRDRRLSVSFSVMILFSCMTGSALVGGKHADAGLLTMLLVGMVPSAIALSLPRALILRKLHIGGATLAAALLMICACAVTAALPMKQLFSAPGAWIAFGALAIFLAILLVAGLRQRDRLAAATAAAMLAWLVLLLISLYGIRIFHGWEAGFSIAAILAGPLLRIWRTSPVEAPRELPAAPGLPVQHIAPIDSSRDALTGAYNRRALDNQGRELFQDALASDRPASVLMLDIDHFKQVNDLYGHAAGDAVLSRFAQVISAQVRGTDFVARYGGEEFAIVLPNAPLAPAMRLAEKMRQAVQELEVMHGERKLKVTTSVGVTSSFPGDEGDFAGTIARADKNLYRAKRNGRNRVMADPLPGEL